MCNEKILELHYDVLRILYEKLLLTRGQIALAVDLLVDERYNNVPKKSPGEAGLYALKELGLEGSFEISENVYKFKIKGNCGFCPIEEVCPIPFFVASVVRKIAEVECSIQRCGDDRYLCEEDGYCVFSIKVYPLRKKD